MRRMENGSVPVCKRGASGADPSEKFLVSFNALVILKASDWLRQNFQPIRELKRSTA